MPTLQGPIVPPASGAPARSMVILLHGYGSNGDDLIGRMVEANQDGSMSDAEVVASCVLLLIAGNETTMRLISVCTFCRIVRACPANSRTAATSAPMVVGALMSAPASGP